MSGMTELLRHALSHIASLGALGSLAFVILYVIACVAFLPVSVLTLGAGAAFGMGRGFCLVWVGATLGACASFLIGRYWLRNAVERRLAGHPVFKAIDAAVSTQGWRVVLLTRLTPFLPFALLNYAYGLTRVRLGEYTWASCLGMMPGTAVFVYVGAAAGEALTAERARTPAEWALLAVGGVAALATAALIGRAARKALAVT